MSSNIAIVGVFFAGIAIGAILVLVTIRLTQTSPLLPKVSSMDMKYFRNLTKSIRSTNTLSSDDASFCSKSTLPPNIPLPTIPLIREISRPTDSRRLTGPPNSPLTTSISVAHVNRSTIPAADSIFASSIFAPSVFSRQSSQPMMLNRQSNQPVMQIDRKSVQYNVTYPLPPTPDRNSFRFTGGMNKTDSFASPLRISITPYRNASVKHENNRLSTINGSEYTYDSESAV
jgi:hypothetical protein